LAQSVISGARTSVGSSFLWSRCAMGTNRCCVRVWSGELVRRGTIERLAGWLG
jgi:hypothetical protein